MITIADTDHVARMIFPNNLMKNGTLHANAFKLRLWLEPKGPEKYVSVNRYESEAFVTDVKAFDKGRNLSCALMEVREIRSIKLFLGSTDNYPVDYDVLDVSTQDHASHAGIFVSVAGKPLDGSGEAVLDSMEDGENKSKTLQIIRRALADLAVQHLTDVETICREKTIKRLSPERQ